LQYLDENTETSEDNIHTKELYEDFTDWIRYNNMTLLNKNKFYCELKRIHTFKKVRTSYNNTHTTGIEFLALKNN
jgi:hypothetical protein